VLRKYLGSYFLHENDFFRFGSLKTRRKNLEPHLTQPSPLFIGKKGEELAAQLAQASSAHPGE